MEDKNNNIDNQFKQHLKDWEPPLENGEMESFFYKLDNKKKKSRIVFYYNIIVGFLLISIATLISVWYYQINKNKKLTAIQSTNNKIAIDNNSEKNNKKINNFDLQDNNYRNNQVKNFIKRHNTKQSKIESTPKIRFQYVLPQISGNDNSTENSVSDFYMQMKQLLPIFYNLEILNETEIGLISKQNITQKKPNSSNFAYIVHLGFIPSNNYKIEYRSENESKVHQELPEFLNSTKISTYGYGIGTNFILGKNKLTFQSGLQYKFTQQNIKTSFVLNSIPIYKDTTGIIVGYIPLPKGQALNLDSQNVKQTSHTFSVPVIAQYKLFENNKFEVSAGAGALLNLFQSKLKFNYFDFTKSKLSASDLANFFITPVYTANIAYKFNSKLKIGLQSQYIRNKYTLNTVDVTYKIRSQQFTISPNLIFTF